MLYCTFCNRECKSKVSQAQHTIRCKLNPNKIIVKPTKGSTGMVLANRKNQYTKQNSTYKMPEQLREKLGEHMRELNTLNWKDSEFKSKHKAAMQQAVLDHPEAYSSSNRGRSKHSVYNGVEMQSSWEEEFAKWLDANGIRWNRSTESFPYVWNGDRRYFPDFHLPDLGLYVEVKGYQTDRDTAKWDHFPHSLVIIKNAQIQEILKGLFDQARLQDLVYKK
jgi:hypothetical protein